MAEWRFPQDRTAYLYTGSGEPIRQAWQTPLTVYTSEAATVPAVIKDLDDEVIVGSLILIGEDGLLPEFSGPDGVSELWVKTTEGDPYRVEAQYGPRIDAIEAALEA